MSCLLVLLLGVGALLIAAAAGLVVAADSDWGRARIAALVAAATANGPAAVTLDGLTGDLLSRPSVRHVRIADARGVWLEIDDVEIVWHARDLFAGRLTVEIARASRLALLRTPQDDGAGGTPSDGDPPLPIEVAQFEIARIELGEAIAGRAALLRASGTARWVRDERSATLAAETLDGGRTRITARWHDGDGRIDSELAVEEASEGWIAKRLGLPAAPSLGLRARLEGAVTDATLSLSAKAGELAAEVQGRLDLPGRAAHLTARARSGAMRPDPALAWQAMDLEAELTGSLATPLLRARGAWRGIAIAGASIEELTLTSDATQAADGAELALGAEARGLRLPGPGGDAVAQAPLAANATLLVAPQGLRVRALRLAHPLLAVDGAGEFSRGILRGEARADLPEIAAFAAALGVEARGGLDATLRLDGPLAAPTLSIVAQLRELAAPAPLPALLGPRPTLEATLIPDGGRLAIPSAALSGSSLHLEAAGELRGDALTGRVGARLVDLAALAPGARGAIAIEAELGGTLAAPRLVATLASDAVTRDELRAEAVRGRVTLDMAGAVPSAVLDLQARVGGEPAQLRARGALAADGAWSLALDALDFPGLHGTGSAAGRSSMPDQARLDIDAADLAPLGRLLAVPMRGAGSVKLTTSAAAGGETMLNAELKLRDGVIAGTAIGALQAQGTLPLVDAPELRAEISASDVQLGDRSFRLAAQARGPLAALRVKVEAEASSLSGSAQGVARLDAAPALTIEQATLRWGDAVLTLRERARIDLTDGVRVERLRLALGGGTLAIDGQLRGETLDARLSATRLPLTLLALLAPELAADGTLEGELRLSGPANAPNGRLRLRAEAVRLREGAGRGLPPARARLDADIAGAVARISGEVTVGSTSTLRLSGQAPLRTDGALALDLAGQLDLALTDPVLAPDGRRARGQLRVQGSLRGTLAAPIVAGDAILSGGSFDDTLAGIRLERIAGSAALRDGMLRIGEMRARAGDGEIVLSGMLAIDPGRGGSDLTLTLRDARVVRSRLATIVADADLALRGPRLDALVATGSIRIRRAEFAVAELQAAGLPQLQVTEVGTPPRRVPRAAPAGGNRRMLDFGLGIDVTAPDTVYVRGRGINAQAGGNLRVEGSLAAPTVGGEVALRRGSVTLAGQTLDFARGKLGFDGGAYADPTLDFEARRETTGITAILRVGGRASAPKLELISEPAMPPDEVLARLLLARPMAELTPLEMAQIGATAAGFLAGTDIGGGSVEKVRRALGLDQLRVAPTRDGTAVGIEAGRTVAPGVYVGVRPGSDLGVPNATIQIEIAPRLRVEADLGTTGRAGVVYELEY